MPYDWKAELGDVPIDLLPGQRSNTHPLTRALGAPDRRAQAVGILSKALVACEGRIEELASLLSCSYPSAYRLVMNAHLQPLSRRLRLEHGHGGPNGEGRGAQRRLLKGKKPAG